MTSVNQDLTPSKPQTFKVITHYGYILLLVDVDGSRWLHLPPFAEWLGLSLVRDIMPRIDSKQRFWGCKLIGGKQCLPADKANSFMGILRVEHAKGPMVAWLGNHCTQTLRKFTIPDVQTPFLVAESEPVPVSFARPDPQFYAPTMPLASPLESGLDGSEIVSIRGTRPVTSTVALARGTDNDHASVIKLVRAYAPQLERFGPIGFEIQMAGNPQGGGRPVEFAYLNEPQSTLLITFMRNSPVVVDFKVRLVEAFIALKEAAPQNPILTMTRLDLLKMAVQSEETIQTLGVENATQKATISELRPNAEGFDLIAGSEGSFTITMAAKQLQTSPHKLTEWLKEHKWIYSRMIEAERTEWESQKVWLAFQDKINSGHMIAKTFPIYHKDGVQTLPQSRITALGLTRLAKHFGAQIGEVA